MAIAIFLPENGNKARTDGASRTGRTLAAVSAAKPILSLYLTKASFFTSSFVLLSSGHPQRYPWTDNE